MMLDYLNRVQLVQTSDNLEEEDIAEILQTNQTGTQFHNIENINKLTKSSHPSIEFEAEFESHTLAEIKEELKSGLPVAVWIKTNDGSMDYAHSVVVIGIDDSKEEITYNDPTYGKKVTIPLSKFMDIWDYWGSVMIKAKIGRITTEPIEKYLEQEKENEHN